MGELDGKVAAMIEATVSEFGRLDALLNVAALGRAGRSEEVAELASFLASDRASYLSGCVIPADGGWSCQLA